MQSKRPKGMFAFMVVWFGQIISLLGSSMSAFAMTIWAYEETGSATALALVGVFYMVPLLVVSPLAGAIVDRHDRKLMMMVSDLAAGLSTIAVLILYSSGNLQIWHLYITNGFIGLFQAFQWPAYSAAITTMLPKEQYGRANGLMSLADTASGVFSPILAGALIGIIGFSGILTIDIITFVFAIGALLLVFIPNPQVTQAGQEGKGNLLREAAYGFRYILKRPSLLALQIVFLVGNFLVGIAHAVQAPMILASTGNNELALASVSSAGAVGGVVGGLIMSAWGGPKRLVYGVLGGWVLASIFGTTLMGLGTDIPIWVVAAFMGTFFIPIINGSNQAIWQAKVAPDIQGRVFSIRRLIAWVSSPLAFLIAGPLADFVMEPAMQPNGALAGTFGGLTGTGPGAGMRLIFITIGLVTAFVTLTGFAFPVLREAEDRLPDHDMAPKAADDPLLTRLQELLAERAHLLSQPRSDEQERALKDISFRLRELGRQRSQA